MRTERDGVVEDSVGGNDETTQAQQLGDPSKGVSTSAHHRWPAVAGLRSPQPARLTMDVVITDQGCGTLKPPQ